MGKELNPISSYRKKIGMFLHFKYPVTKARNKITGARKAFKGSLSLQHELQQLKKLSFWWNPIYLSIYIYICMASTNVKSIILKTN